MNFLYFDVEHAIKAHDYIILNSGGLLGINKKGQLESILDFVREDTYYPTLEDKATYLFFSINKGHCFVDGNKRASIVLTAYFFMELNGLTNIVGRFISEMENIAVDIADNVIDRDVLLEIIKSIIYMDYFSEELKLKLLNAKINKLLDNID